MSILLALMLMATSVIFLKMIVVRRMNTVVPKEFASPSYQVLRWEWILGSKSGNKGLALPGRSPRFAFGFYVVEKPRLVLGGLSPAFVSLFGLCSQCRTSFS